MPMKVSVPLNAGFQSVIVDLADLHTDFGAKYDGSDSSAAMIAAIAGTPVNGGGTLNINGPVVLNPLVPTTFVVPANIDLRFSPGGKITVGTNATLTIVGRINAGAWQIFNVAGGTVNTTGDCRTPIVLPEWWGAVAGGAGGTGTDSSAAMQAAQVFSEFFGGTLMLRSIIYTMKAALTVRQPSKIIGGTGGIAGELGYMTALDFTTAAAGVNGIVVNPNLAGLNNPQIANLSITRQTQVAAGSGCYGLALYAVNHGTFTNVGVSGFDQNLLLTGAAAGTANTPCIACVFDTCQFGSHATRSIFWNNATSCEFRNCEIASYGVASETIYLASNQTIINDTALFIGCRIGNYQFVPVLVRILGGIYHTFRDCDIETATTAGIVIQLNYDLDTSTPCLLVDNCWLDNCGISVQNAGYLPSLSIINCQRMAANVATVQTEAGTGRSVSIPAVTACIIIDDSRAINAKKNVVISNNNMVSYNTAGACAQINHCNAAAIQNNDMTIVGSARPAVALLSSTGNNAVTGNRITSSTTLISDAGASNYTTPNYAT